MPFNNCFLVQEQGGTSVEYAVMLALIAGVCLVAIVAVGFMASGWWGDSATGLRDRFDDVGVGIRN